MTVEQMLLEKWRSLPPHLAVAIAPSLHKFCRAEAIVRSHIWFTNSPVQQRLAIFVTTPRA
jgi:hypothetical protein